MRSIKIDVIRGVAIILVIVFHINIHITNLYSELISKLFEKGRYGVELFFLIS
jgi:peptidoglycan/LPS O-acetylase OafA/YrhL